MSLKNSLDALETFKNTGSLDVQALTLQGTNVTSATAGVTSASQFLVPDSSKNLDTLGIKDLLTGATPVHAVDPASCTITSAAGASSNHSTLTIQLKDGAGNNISRVVPFKIYLSDASTGIGLTSTAASTGLSVTSGGGATDGAAVTKSISCVSSATGGCVIDLLDTSQTAYYAVLALAGGIKVTSAAVTYHA